MGNEINQEKNSVKNESGLDHLKIRNKNLQ